MKSYLTIITFIAIIFCSCNNTDSEPQKQKLPPRHFEDNLELSLGAVGVRQRSIKLSLANFIIFDTYEKKFVFDLPEEDDEFFLNKKTYEEMKELIKQLNRIAGFE